MSDDASLISASDLGKQYGDEWAVQGVSLDIRELRVVGLIGPSGCGKTTLVRLMNGAIAPSAGSVRLLGNDPQSFGPADQQRMGYLPQQPVLFPELSLWENLNFHASLAGVRFRRRARLRDLLDFVELGPDRKKKVHEASGGMQRRLALAATLVHRPEVLFLDEPTAGIDPILRRRIWDRFRELRDQGTLLMVTTQYVTEAAYCDDVGILSDGRLLSLGTPAALARSAYGGEIIEITTEQGLPDNLLIEGQKLDGVVRMERPSVTTTWLVVDDASARIPTVEQWLQHRGVTSASVEQPAADYDDIFVRVIEASRASASETGASAA